MEIVKTRNCVETRRAQGVAFSVNFENLIERCCVYGEQEKQVLDTLKLANLIKYTILLFTS